MRVFSYSLLFSCGFYLAKASPLESLENDFGNSLEVCFYFAFANKKGRGIDDRTFQIAAVEPEYVWGENPHRMTKRHDLHGSSDDNAELLMATSEEESEEFQATSKTQLNVCDECWWKPPPEEPPNYTPCPKECPPPEPICNECEWQPPCSEPTEDASCDWEPCPDICAPPKNKPAPVPPCKPEQPKCERKSPADQIWDGQIQHKPWVPPTPCPPPPKPCVTQIWDGQIQNYPVTPKPCPPRPTQIWDGQIQCPPPRPWYKRLFKRNQSKNYQRSGMTMP